MLAVLKSGNVVITAKLDRMFRSALDALVSVRSGSLRQFMGNRCERTTFTGRA
jgi:hypothetical protein